LAFGLSSLCFNIETSGETSVPSKIIVSLA